MSGIWYILIQVSLGLVGFQYFTFTNQGALLAALPTAAVQGYAVWELHRIAHPKFLAALAEAPTPRAGERMRRDYRNRLLKVYATRVGLFTLLTLAAATAVRGA